ncbi:hypothetical protein K456DRAFT_1716874 [Colletotrichum gloeosporioides 23]|nr:hypothetical protein K456DRAFT_1716874 [Colletotrichum gloeosporioides 23]
MAQTSANIPKDSGEAILAADETTDDAVSVLGLSGPLALINHVDQSDVSILDYRTENGRTYHRYKDGKYSYPNDETENDRLEMQHNLFLVTYDNKLGTAPPNDTSLGVEVKRVLDVGTGTGVWAVEFGDEHPEAEVLGVDLSAIQPDFAPPNVKFEIDDIEEPWTFAQPFDYIHSRMMTSSLSDWRVYLQRCYESRPGPRWLLRDERDGPPLSDDGTLRPEHALHRYLALVFSALEKSGRAFQSIPALRGMMLDIGFRDVTMTKYKWPTNPWAKDAKHKKIGAWNNENLNAGVEAWAMAPFTRVHGWTRVEVQGFLVDVRKDLGDRRIHAYWPMQA